MSQARTATASRTYTDTDVAKVINRVRADLTMIAESTGTWNTEYTNEIIHDIECLTKEGYLAQFDLTLLSDKFEVKATRYVVNTNAGTLSMSRPGGVLWPMVDNAKLRIVLFYTSKYDSDSRKRLLNILKRPWSRSSADTSHSALTNSGARDYASNDFAMQRRDWTS